MNVRSVEHLSEKTKKNVQPAEVKTPEADSPVAAAEDVPVMPFTLSPKQIRKAEAIGLPVNELLQWATSVEQRFQIIARDVAKAPERVVDELQKRAQAAQQQRIQQMKQEGVNPQQGGRGGSVIQALQLAQQSGILGGGGGIDEEMMKMQKEIMSMSIQRMKADIDFTQTIKNAIVGKISAKAAASILE